MRRWISAPCVRVKDGGKEVRVKNWKPLRSHQCPQLWDCAEEEQVNFSHWSASLSPPVREWAPSCTSSSSSSCFSIRSSIMLESAVSRNQAADPPQLLQEKTRPLRRYITAEPMVMYPKALQFILASNKKILLSLIYATILVVNVLFFGSVASLHLQRIKKGKNKK